MRLTRPTLVNPLVITSEAKDLPNTLFSQILENDVAAVRGTETIAAGQFMLLPQSFGNIYLGETFSSYICVHNCTPYPVQSVVVKVRGRFSKNTRSTEPKEFFFLLGWSTVGQNPYQSSNTCQQANSNHIAAKRDARRCHSSWSQGNWYSHVGNCYPAF